MRTVVRVTSILTIILFLTGTVWASPAQNGAFTLEIPLFTATIEKVLVVGQGGAQVFENPDLFTMAQIQQDCLAGNYQLAKATGYSVAGAVTESSGVLQDLAGASFSYTENITLFCKSGRAINRGQLTVSASDMDQILVNFWGQTDATATIIDQPFVVLSGTGAYEGMHGRGVRNSLDSPSPYVSFVEYSGHFFQTPR